MLLYLWKDLQKSVSLAFQPYLTCHGWQADRSVVQCREVVFDKMVIALFSNEGLGKENYAETINGAILEERILAAGALA